MATKLICMAWINVQQLSITAMPIIKVFLLYVENDAFVSYVLKFILLYSVTKYKSYAKDTKLEKADTS